MSSHRLYVRDVTPVPPLALVLFGGNLASLTKQNSAQSELTIDGWIKLAVPARLKDTLMQIRTRLDSLLAGWVSHKGKKAGGMRANISCEALLDAIVHLLSVQKEAKLGARLNINPNQLAKPAGAQLPAPKAAGAGLPAPKAAGPSPAMMKAGQSPSEDAVAKIAAACGLGATLAAAAKVGPRRLQPTEDNGGDSDAEFAEAYMMGNMAMQMSQSVGGGGNSGGDDPDNDVYMMGIAAASGNTGIQPGLAGLVRSQGTSQPVGGGGNSGGGDSDNEAYMMGMAASGNTGMEPGLAGVVRNQGLDNDVLMQRMAASGIDASSDDASTLDPTIWC